MKSTSIEVDFLFFGFLPRLGKNWAFRLFRYFLWYLLIKGIIWSTFLGKYANPFSKSLSHINKMNVWITHIINHNLLHINSAQSCVQIDPVESPHSVWLCYNRACPKMFSILLQLYLIFPILYMTILQFSVS